MDYKEIGILVSKIQAGDTSAFSALYEKTYKHALFHARLMLKNEADIEDALQDAYTTAFLKMNTLDAPEAFVSWLDTIVVNSCRHKLRSLGRWESHEAESFDDEDFFVELVAADGETPDKVMDMLGTEEIIAGMIDKLPDAQKQAVIMYYFDEKSIAEIAELLEVSENTVKSRLNYARKYIKNAVLEEEKRGIKLYSLSPALLLAAIKQLIGAEELSPASYAAVAKSISESIGIDMGISAASIGSSAGAEAVKTVAAKSGRHIAQQSGTNAVGSAVGKAAATGAKVAKDAITLKTIAIIAASAVAIGGTATAVHIHNTHNELPEEPPAIVETVSESPVIIEETPEIVEETPAPVVETPAFDFVTPYQNLLENLASTRNITDDILSRINNNYSIYDMDLDGIPELIVKSGTCEADTKYTLYSLDAETAAVKEVGDLGSGHMVICPYSAGPGILGQFGHMGYEKEILYQYSNGQISESTLVAEHEIPIGVDYTQFETLQTFALNDFSGLEWNGNPADNNAALIG